MPIGARDNIDRELVKKYSKLKMDNPETTRMIDTQTILDTMQEYANLQRSMIEVDKKVSEICAAVRSKSAKYIRINFNPPARRRPA